MVKDLRSFIDELLKKPHEYGGVLRLKNVNINNEITAIQWLLQKSNKYPVIIIDEPVLPNGDISSHMLITNITADRNRVGKILGISDPKHMASELSNKINNKVEPIIIKSSEAPVKDAVFDELPIDLPFPIHFPLNIGQYITAGVVVTYDPDTGIDNESIQRLWIKDRNTLGYNPLPTSHNYKNIMKFWSSGEDAPIVIWIGHHPAYVMGAAFKLGYPESHYPLMSSLAGEPIRLTRSELFGDKILVPADAEIVIEGVVPKDVYEVEGPFSEYPGTYSPQTLNPIIEVKKVYMRRDAIIYDIGPGLADHQLLGALAIESLLYRTLKSVFPQILNVHVPLSASGRFHAYIQVHKDRPGLGIDVGLMALSIYWSLKHVFVLDDDVDVFDDHDVLWAIATRLHKNGILIIPDPKFTYKAVFDCTKPAPDEETKISLAPLRIKPPEDIIKKWENLIK
jgi:UbiD family decarboxylase